MRMRQSKAWTNVVDANSLALRRLTCQHPRMKPFTTENMIQTSSVNSSSLPTALLEFLQNQPEVSKIQVPAGVSVCQSGDHCESLVLVLHGQVKVFRPAASGRSVTLYYVGSQESCILTASCILNDSPFPAFAETMTEVEALSIPPHKVKQWLAEEPLWQQYILGLLSRRMADLIELVNALAFQALDVRLANWLLVQSALYPDSSHLETTHQYVAEDLASSREVISRLLKEFEIDGLIKLGRGTISILDQNALREIVKQ